MKYSALKDDINKIQNIQYEYMNMLNALLNDYINDVSNWSSSIGNELINSSVIWCVNYILFQYTNQINKIKNADNGSYSFVEVSKYCCASEVSMKDTKQLQNNIFSSLDSIKSTEIKLEVKENFDITDEKIYEFENIVRSYITKINNLLSDFVGRVYNEASNNVLAQPLEYYINIENKIFSDYFIDQHEIYFIWLNDLIKNRRKKMKQITEEAIAQQKAGKGDVFFTNQASDAYKRASATGAIPNVMSDNKKNANSVNSEANNSKIEIIKEKLGIIESLKEKNEYKKIKKQVEKQLIPIHDELKKLDTKSVDTKLEDEMINKLDNILKLFSNKDIKDKQDMYNRQRVTKTIKSVFFSPIKDFGKDLSDVDKLGITKPVSVFLKALGSIGCGVCDSISEWNDPKYDLRFDNVKGEDRYKLNTKLEAKQKSQIFDNFSNEKEIKEITEISTKMSPDEYKKYLADNSDKIAKVVYNNEDYKYLYNMSDANLVKLGLAEHYEKVTGKNIANTPITFNPYINNVVNNQDKYKNKNENKNENKSENKNEYKPELKVKKEQIDELNKKIGENKDFNKINFEKLNKDIEEIKSKRFVYDPNKKENDKEPYDGLVPVNKDSEMHKLVEAIRGLTDSIKAPDLLTSKNNRFNDETMSQLFEAIERNNDINNVIKDFINRLYGYSGYKDGTFDANNYQDLNYALKNRINFRPNNIYSQKLSKAKEFGSDSGNMNIINMLKGAAKGVLNIGATLALSAISLPVGIVYGIGSIASAVATAPRDEYKDMIDNLGEEAVDTLVNDYKFDDETKEYKFIEN